MSYWDAVNYDIQTNLRWDVEKSKLNAQKRMYDSQGKTSNSTSSFGGYGSQADADNAAEARRLREGQAASDLRLREADLNRQRDLGARDWEYQNRSNIDNQTFQFKQGLMEQITNRMKDRQSSEASKLWKTAGAK